MKQSMNNIASRFVGRPNQLEEKLKSSELLQISNKIDSDCGSTFAQNSNNV